MAHQLTAVQKAKFRGAFDLDADGETTTKEWSTVERSFALFDLNRDGAIAASELGLVMRSLGLNPSEAELEAILANLDADGNGRADLPEFLALMAGQINRADKKDVERVKEVFKLFDGRNEWISAAALRYLMTNHLAGEKFSKAEVDEMIENVDREGDGQISYRDFMKMVVITFSK